MLLIFFSHQEKLAKSIHYLISKEDQVRTQITGLEQLISQTEVRALTQAVAEPNLSNHHRQPLEILTWPSVYLQFHFYFHYNTISTPSSPFPFPTGVFKFVFDAFVIFRRKMY